MEFLYCHTPTLKSSLTFVPQYSVRTESMRSRDDRQQAEFSDLLAVFNLVSIIKHFKFEKFDKDQCGFLHETGILAALKSLGFNRTGGDIRFALKNGEVDYSQKKITFSGFKRVSVCIVIPVKIALPRIMQTRSFWIG